MADPLKIAVTIDSDIAHTYQLRTSTRLKAALEIAVEQVIKKLDQAEGVYGKLLFNRPGVIRVEIS